MLEPPDQRISSGEPAPGEQMPSERELMDFYGVGRPAVREALQELERSGIVEIPTASGRASSCRPPNSDRQPPAARAHLLRTQPDTLRT